METIKKSSYRQRVYQMQDGSIVLIYGDDLVPVDVVKLLADHDVTEMITVVDHPQDAP